MSQSGLHPKTRTILIVDDEPSMLTTLHRLLDDDAAIVSTTSPREALAWIQRGASYDVILCDMGMPEMGGAEFHDAVKEIAPEIAERILFFTGGVTTAEAEEFLKEHRVLEKPFTFSQLKAALGLVA